jgi:hypothetical protein
MPSTTSTSVFEALALVDRDDAVLADLSMASARIAPIVRVVVGGDRARPAAISVVRP